MKKIIEAIIRYLIAKLLKGYHLHRDPARKPLAADAYVCPEMPHENNS